MMKTAIDNAKKPAVCFFIIMILVAPVSLALLSSYLRYSDRPVKSDIVVLFCGDDMAARQKEAVKLLAEGYARYLIVPALNRWASLKTHGLLVPIDHNYPTGDSETLLKKNMMYPEYYENTHFEVSEANRIMSKYGFRTAIFVSAPYHMRRIKLITGAVFKKARNVSFVPESFEKHGDGAWMSIKWICGEFTKIIWFEIYSHLMAGN